MKLNEEFTETERGAVGDFIRSAIAEVLWNHDQERLAEIHREHLRSASVSEKCRYSNLAFAVMNALPKILTGAWPQE